ncbi:MAG: hypothetical protein H6997_02080 [Moraxellaceae bacterium]|nr:hypothetical protein [Moraxellaceae bacterium]
METRKFIFILLLTNTCIAAEAPQFPRTSTEMLEALDGKWDCGDTEDAPELTTWIFSKKGTVSWGPVSLAGITLESTTGDLSPINAGKGVYLWHNIKLGARYASGYYKPAGASTPDKIIIFQKVSKNSMHFVYVMSWNGWSKLDWQVDSIHVRCTKR